jgi:hypothetical protein
MGVIYDDHLARPHSSQTEQHAHYTNKPCIAHLVERNFSSPSPFTSVNSKTFDKALIRPKAV